MDLKRRNKKRVLRPDVIVATPHKDVYMYHDYRAFLNDEIKRQTTSYAGFSMRSIARTAGIAPGHLSMVLSGKKNLSVGKRIETPFPRKCGLARRGNLRSLRVVRVLIAVIRSLPSAWIGITFVAISHTTSDKRAAVEPISF